MNANTCLGAIMKSGIRTRAMLASALLALMMAADLPVQAQPQPQPRFILDVNVQGERRSRGYADFDECERALMFALVRRGRPRLVITPSGIDQLNAVNVRMLESMFDGGGEVDLQWRCPRHILRRHPCPFHCLRLRVPMPAAAPVGGGMAAAAAPVMQGVPAGPPVAFHLDQPQDQQQRPVHPVAALPQLPGVPEAPFLAPAEQLEQEVALILERQRMERLRQRMEQLEMALFEQRIALEMATAPPAPELVVEPVEPYSARRARERLAELERVGLAAIAAARTPVYMLQLVPRPQHRAVHFVRSPTLKP